MVLVIHRFHWCAVDTFRRLIAWFWLTAFFVVGFSACQRANAETIPATPSTETVPLNTIKVYLIDDNGTPYTSFAAAISAYCSTGGKVSCGTSGSTGGGYGADCSAALQEAPVDGSSNSICYKVDPDPNYGAFSRVYTRIATQCPLGWTPDGSNCTRTTYSCPATGGWTLQGTECTRNVVCPDAGTPIPGNVYGYPGRFPTVSFCVGGCTVNAANGSVSGQSPNGEWFTQWYGPFTAGGNPCTQPSGGTGPTEAPRCPVDQCMGEVNGVQVCVQCRNRDVNEPPSTTTTGSTQPGQPGTQTTETTTTRTECGPAGCTTTTTTTTVEQPTDSNGNPSGPPRTTTTTKVEPNDGTEMGEYCEKNPSAPICKKSSFGGSCGSFSCDGDAIQCAIASEQHRRNCELLTDSGSLTRTDAVNAFNSGVATFDKTTLTTTAPLASITGQTLYASALADQTYVIKGQSFTIPFSSLVEYLNYAGIAFMIVCGMVSVRIFSTVLG